MAIEKREHNYQLCDYYEQRSEPWLDTPDLAKSLDSILLVCGYSIFGFSCFAIGYAIGSLS